MPDGDLRLFAKIRITMSSYESNSHHANENEYFRSVRTICIN